jgi:hypothetical protein
MADIVWHEALEMNLATSHLPNTERKFHEQLTRNSVLKYDETSKTSVQHAAFLIQ